VVLPAVRATPLHRTTEAAAMSAVELVDRLIAGHDTSDPEALAACYAPSATVCLDG
jgi:hypothetical protein